MRRWMQIFDRSRNIAGLLGVLLILWLGYNTGKVILQNYELVQTIDRLEEEIAILELQNENLKFNINYYASDAFLELEARDKLTRVAVGEKLLILPEDRYDLVKLDDGSPSARPPAIDNLHSWLDFLFGKNR